MDEQGDRPQASYNCAHACRFVLNAAGFDLGNPYFDTPTKLFKDLWNADEKRKAGDK